MQTLAWQHGVLDPQGPIAAAERTILLNATVIMLAVVVPVILLTLAFAWWFRAGNKWARRTPDWAYSGPVEVTVWSIPTLVILFLGGIAWIGSHDLDPARPVASTAAPMEVQVVSLDWKWLFIYPDLGVASVNRLVVPGGHAAAPAPDLGHRDEQLLRAAARLADLHDGRHDDDAAPAGRPARHLRRAVGAVQRRRLLRHALRHRRDAAGAASTTGSPARAPGRTRSTRRTTRRWRGPASACRRRRSADVAPGLFEAILAASVKRPAGRIGHAACDGVTCSAS